MDPIYNQLTHARMVYKKILTVQPDRAFPLTTLEKVTKQINIAWPRIIHFLNKDTDLIQQLFTPTNKIDGIVV